MISSRPFPIILRRRSYCCYEGRQVPCLWRGPFPALPRTHCQHFLLCKLPGSFTRCLHQGRVRSCPATREALTHTHTPLPHSCTSERWGVLGFFRFLPPDPSGQGPGIPWSRDRCGASGCLCPLSEERAMPVGLSTQCLSGYECGLLGCHACLCVLALWPSSPVTLDG